MSMENEFVWWKVVADTVHDGETHRRTLYSHYESPAEALTRGEETLLAMHEGAVLAGAWLYAWDGKPVPEDFA